MAGGKEIRTQIKSIQSTQKITRAMEMVAASKMRKAQQRMQAPRPYAEKIRNVIHHLSLSHSEYQHEFFIKRDVKRVGVIVVSSDRGLCGGLNVNLFRFLLDKMKPWMDNSVDVRLGIIGSKAMSFFSRFGMDIVASTTHLGDAPHIKDVIGPVGVMIKEFQNNGIDELYLVYNRFINTMTQKPTMLSLLPISPEIMEQAPSDEEQNQLKKYWDYIYEPDAKELLDALLVRFFESQVYQGAVENFASEQAARMVAMKSATDNAGELIDELQLAYNKARQAAITQELSEIVGGAAAV